MGNQNVGGDCQQCDRREILHRIKRQFRVKTRTDAEVGDVTQNNAVSVGRGTGDEFRADVAIAASTIIDHHLLAQRIGQTLRQRACKGIGTTAGREGHNEPHRANRVNRFRHRCR